MDGRVNGPDKVSECSRTEALLLGGVEPTPALRIVKIKKNCQATALQFFTRSNSEKCVYQCDCILWLRELLLPLECFNSIG